MRRIMLVFTMIALVTTMVAVGALSGSAQANHQYDEESDEESDDWYDDWLEGHTKADPPDEDDSLPGAGARSRTRVPA